MGWRMRNRGRPRRARVATLHHTIWRTRARKSFSMSANAETLMMTRPFSSGPEPGEATRAAKPSVERVGGGPPGLLRDLPDQVVVEVGATAPEEIEGRAHQAPVLEAEGRVVPQRLDGLREAAFGEAVDAAEDERHLGEDDGTDEDGLAGSDRAGDDAVRRPRLPRIVSLVEMADEDVGVEGDHRRLPRRTARRNRRATDSSTACFMSSTLACAPGLTR